MIYHILPTKGIKWQRTGLLIKKKTMFKNDINKNPKGTFLISNKLINWHQQKDFWLTAKLKSVKYELGSFCGFRNTTELITNENKILILEWPQKYILLWYHTYIFHPRLGITEDISCQHVYWTVMRDAVKKRGKQKWMMKMYKTIKYIIWYNSG